MRLFSFRFGLASLCMAALFITGCETQISQPAEMTLQAKTAFEVLPSNVRMVAALDVASAHQEGLMDTWFDTADLQGEALAQFQDFIEMTGFDPREDVREVYATLSDSEGDKRSASLVVYANFDQDRLTTYIENKLGDELQQDTYKGTPIYFGTSGHDGELYMAPVNDDMLVAASPREALIAMLDRLNGQGSALVQNAEIMRLIDKVAHPDGAWMVMQDPFSHMDRSNRHKDTSYDQLMTMVQDVVVATGFEHGGLDVDVKLTTRSGVNPSDVAAAMKGVVAGMKMSSKQDSPMLNTLDHMKIKERGDGVNIQVFVDAETLSSLKGK